MSLFQEPRVPERECRTLVPTVRCRLTREHGGDTHGHPLPSTSWVPGVGLSAARALPRFINFLLRVMEPRLREIKVMVLENGGGILTQLHLTHVSRDGN